MIPSNRPEQLENARYQIDNRAFLPLNTVNVYEIRLPKQDKTLREAYLQDYQQIIDERWEDRIERIPETTLEQLCKFEKLDFVETKEDDKDSWRVRIGITETDFKRYIGSQWEADIPVALKPNPLSVNVFANYGNKFLLGLKPNGQLHTPGSGFSHYHSSYGPEQPWVTTVREFLEESHIPGLNLENFIDGEILIKRGDVAAAIAGNVPTILKLDDQLVKEFREIQKLVFKEIMPREFMFFLGTPNHYGERTMTIYSRLFKPVERAHEIEFDATVELELDNDASSLDGKWKNVANAIETGEIEGHPINLHAYAGLSLLYDNRHIITQVG